MAAVWPPAQAAVGFGGGGGGGAVRGTGVDAADESDMWLWCIDWLACDGGGGLAGGALAAAAACCAAAAPPRGGGGGGCSCAAALAAALRAVVEGFSSCAAADANVVPLQHVSLCCATCTFLRHRWPTLWLSTHQQALCNIISRAIRWRAPFCSELRTHSRNVRFLTLLRPVRFCFRFFCLPLRL